jgi:hypothetical protein
MDLKAIVKEIVTVSGSSGSDGGGSGATQAGTKQAPKATSDPKVVG